LNIYTKDESDSTLFLYYISIAYEYIKPNKKKSTEEIDGTVALIIGLARATIGGGVNDSVYSERGYCSYKIDDNTC
jgi:hypothetical protein